MKSLLPLCALSVLFLASTSGVARAQSPNPTPEQIATECVNTINQIVNRNISAATAETNEAIQKIKRALAAGNEQAAIRIAREYVGAATKRTSESVARIIQLARQCVSRLNELGYESLAKRVGGVAETAIIQLQSLLKRETAAIEKALSGG